MSDKNDKENAEYRDGYQDGRNPDPLKNVVTGLIGRAGTYKKGFEQGVEDRHRYGRKESKEGNDPSPKVDRPKRTREVKTNSESYGGSDSGDVIGGLFALSFLCLVLYAIYSIFFAEAVSEFSKDQNGRWLFSSGQIYEATIKAGTRSRDFTGVTAGYGQVYNGGPEPNPCFAWTAPGGVGSVEFDLKFMFSNEPNVKGLQEYHRLETIDYCVFSQSRMSYSVVVHSLVDQKVEVGWPFMQSKSRCRPGYNTPEAFSDCK